MAIAALLLLPACTTRLTTNTERTATQQLLGTQAIERAVERLAWPDLEGASVFVEIATSAEQADRDYLHGALEAALVQRGARVAPEHDAAQRHLLVLAGALGTDQRTTFLGIPAFESLLLPVTVPELALYASHTQHGFARLEGVWWDAASGRLLQRVDPVQAQTWTRARKVLFVSWWRTDTTRLDR